MKEKTAINENTQLAKNVKAKGKEVSVSEEAIVRRFTAEERKVFRRVKWKDIQDLPEEQMRELDKRVERREEDLDGRISRFRALFYGMGLFFPIICWGFGEYDMASMFYFEFTMLVCAYMTASVGIGISVILRPIYWVLQLPVIRLLGALLFGIVTSIGSGSVDGIEEAVIESLKNSRHLEVHNSMLIIVFGIIFGLVAGLINNPHKVMARQEYARMVCQRGAGAKKTIDPKTLPKAKRKGFFAKRREAKENIATIDREHKKVVKSVKRNSSFTLLAIIAATIVANIINEYVKTLEYDIGISLIDIVVMSIAVMLVLGYRAAYSVSFGYALFSAIRNGVLLILTSTVMLSIDPEMGGLEGVINSLEYMWDQLLLISLAWLAPTLIGGILGSIFKKVNKGARARKRERRRAKRAAANAKAKAKEKQNKEGSKKKAQAQKK
ncbi:MAG: hypothetical protein IJV74_01020 [Clostridia bacterium]|nr:hypothetical protein [Clostridia bacterium]